MYEFNAQLKIIILLHILKGPKEGPKNKRAINFYVTITFEQEWTLNFFKFNALKVLKQFPLMLE